MSEGGRDLDRATERFVAMGLERDPFPDTDLQLDFYASGARERHMDALTDLWGLGRPLVLVTGPEGVGRSTFFQILQRRLPDDARVARVTAGVFLSARNMLRAVARAMGIGVDAEESCDGIRERLYQQIIELGAARTLCAVLVDDADELEAEAFNELVSLAELFAESPNVRVLLFGSENLPRAVADVVGEERVEPLVHQIGLDPFSLNELRGYLQFRLERAGLNGASPFSERDYQEIYVASRGLPRLANGVARRILLERGSRWSRQHMMLAGGVAALLVLVVLAVVLDPAPAADTAAAPEERRAVETRGAPVTVDVTRNSSQRQETAADVRDRGWLPLPERELAGAAQRSPAGDAVPVTPLPPADEEQSPPSPSPPSPSPPSPSPPPSTPTRDEPEAPAADPVPDTESTRHPLMDREPNRFVLQVFVLSARGRAEAWIEGQARAGDYQIYRRRRDGTDQYVIVEGNYPNRDAAQAAMAGLAAETGQSPFLRELRSIHAELLD